MTDDKHTDSTRRTANRTRLLGFAVALMVAASCVGLGVHRFHLVFPKDAPAEASAETAFKVPDSRLVVESTFSGVAREGERLVSTYRGSIPISTNDAGSTNALPAAPDNGKRACPT